MSEPAVTVHPYRDSIEIVMDHGLPGTSSDIITLRGYAEVAWLRDALTFHLHNMESPDWCRRNVGSV
jgi:hypothetical protein